MLDRRSFLRAVRNMVAAGVLCSGMLVDALEKGSFELADVYPSLPVKVTYLHKYNMSFLVSEELMEDNLYSSITIDGAKWSWQPKESS